MAARIGSKNFEFVITAVTIQRQVGGSLAGLFDMVADTVRNRQQFAKKIKGLTAMGRASAYVLIGLPFFVALMLTLLNSRVHAPALAHEHGPQADPDHVRDDRDRFPLPPQNRQLQVLT